MRIMPAMIQKTNRNLSHHAYDACNDTEKKQQEFIHHVYTARSNTHKIS